MPGHLQPTDPSRLARLITRQGQKRHLAALWAAAAGIETGMTILDVGAGTGALSLEYAALVGPGGQVLALDPDSDCLAHIAAEAARRFLAIHTLQGTAETLPKLPAIPDRIMLTDALHHMTDPLAALRALHAILPKHGVLFIAEYDPDAPGLVGAKRSRRTPRTTLVTLLATAGFAASQATDVPDEHYILTAVPA